MRTLHEVIKQNGCHKLNLELRGTSKTIFNLHTKSINQRCNSIQINREKIWSERARDLHVSFVVRRVDLRGLLVESYF